MRNLTPPTIFSSGTAAAAWASVDWALLRDFSAPSDRSPRRWQYAGRADLSRSGLAATPLPDRGMMANVPLPHSPIQADAQCLVQQLRRSREEMDHFVRALSHDMTANFMVLDGSFKRLKAALAAGDRKEQDRRIAHVDACLRESRRFLDDLVLLAKTGTVQMEPRSVEVGEVVDEVLFEQRELLTERGVEVDVHRPLLAVWCNPQRLKQVLTNLVRNAVKHGCDPRRPRMSISTDLEEDRTGPPSCPLVALRVQDNGRGIDSCYHEEIFLPGRRVSSYPEEGAGMGLAIVRKIAEYYGGSAAVDPSCPSGTALVVRFPISPEPTRRQETARFPRDPNGLRRTEHDAPHEEYRAHHHRSSKVHRRSARRG